jgi:hypothetical protein
MVANEQEAVHARTLRTLTENRVTSIETNVVYATATKPRSDEPQ